MDHKEEEAKETSQQSTSTSLFLRQKIKCHCQDQIHSQQLDSLIQCDSLSIATRLTIPTVSATETTSRCLHLWNKEGVSCMLTNEIWGVA
jgi:hypothetical protein